jgi:glycosyltransferase involved in cell wall biosynthesis
VDGGETTVLEMCLRRFREAHGTQPLIVMAEPQWAGDERLKRIVEGADCVIRAAPSRNPSTAAHEIAAQTGAGVVAIASLQTALAPRDLLPKCVAFHVAAGRTFTEVVGLPAGCSLDLFDAGLLSEASGFPAKIAPGGPGDVVRRILEAGTSVGAAVPESLRAGQFVLAEHYPIDPRDLPESILFTSKDELEVLQRVVASRLDGAEEDIEFFRRWKHEAISRTERLRRPRVAGAASGGPLRVMYVSNPSAYSGAEESLVQAICGVRSLGVEASAVIGKEGRFTQRLRDSGVKTWCPNHDFSRPDRSSIRAFKEAVSGARPDVFHINGYSGLTAPAVAEMLDIPVVCHLRVANPLKYSDEWRASDAVIAVSNFVAERALMADILPERVHVIYDGIDCERFRPGCVPRLDACNEWQVPAGRQLLIGMVARLTPYKRHNLAITAIRALADAGIDTQLVIVGECFAEPDYFDEVLELINRLGIQQRVTFLPFQEDIRRFHTTVDVLVSCSDDEPLGTAVLESMSMDRPVVVSNSGGLPELIRDGETGIVVPAGDANAIAVAITTLWKSNEFRNLIVANARSYVRDSLDFRQCAASLVGLYRAVVNDECYGTAVA